MNAYNETSHECSHHAQLLVGTREWALSCILPEYRCESVDVIHHTYRRMNIGDVRALIRETQLRPVDQPRRVFLIDVIEILEEAQNALLKLFEEPHEHIFFYLITPYERMLLPTLRSRLHVHGVEVRTTSMDDFELFRALSLPERLDEIARRIKKEDLSWVEHIVSGGITYARVSKDVACMRAVESVDTYIRTTGASKKMLLEHLALSL